MKKIINLTIISLFFSFITLSFSAGAQSKSFKMGQWTEIHSAIIKELNRSYVDSLPVDRIMRASVA